MQMSPQVRAIMGFSPPSETKQITPVTDRGYSQEYGSLDRAMSSVAMTKSDMSRASFAKTLNSNIKKINGILGAYKIEDILLREWKLTEGRVVPAGDVWTGELQDIDAYVAGLKLNAATSKTAKKNVKVTVKGDITALKAAGYTVKYKFYRSTKKASKYAALKTKDANTFTNMRGSKGTRYYYKAKVLVYDGRKLVAQTLLKQCSYGTRIWSK